MIVVLQAEEVVFGILILVCGGFVCTYLGFMEAQAVEGLEVLQAQSAREDRDVVLLDLDVVVGVGVGQCCSFGVWRNCKNAVSTRQILG